MLERREQLRVQPRQAGEVLGVEPVRLAALTVDEPQLPWVGHQHLVAQTLKQSADPWGVGAGLDGYPHPLSFREVPFERRGACADLALFDHFAVSGVDEAQVAVPVAYVSTPAMTGGRDMAKGSSFLGPIWVRLHCVQYRKAYTTHFVTSAFSSHL